MNGIEHAATRSNDVIPSTMILKLKFSKTVMCLGIASTFISIAFITFAADLVYHFLIISWIAFSQTLRFGGGMWRNSIIEKNYNTWFDSHVFNLSNKNFILAYMPAVICFPLWIFNNSVISLGHNISEVFNLIIIVFVFGVFGFFIGFYFHWARMNKSKGKRLIFIRHSQDEGYVIIEKSLVKCQFNYRYLSDPSLLMLHPRVMRIDDTDITMEVFIIGQKKARIDINMDSSKDIEKAKIIEDTISTFLFQ